MATVISFRLETWDPEVQSFSITDLVNMGIPRTVIDTVDQGCFLDLIEERSAGYLLRVEDTFYTMIGSYCEIIPAVGFPFFLQHGFSWFSSTNAYFLEVPTGTLINSRVISKPFYMDLHPLEDETEGLRDYVVGGVPVRTAIIRIADV